MITTKDERKLWISDIFYIIGYGTLIFYGLGVILIIIGFYLSYNVLQTTEEYTFWPRLKIFGKHLLIVIVVALGIFGIILLIAFIAYLFDRDYGPSVWFIFPTGVIIFLVVYSWKDLKAREFHGKPFRSLMFLANSFLTVSIFFFWQEVRELGYYDPMGSWWPNYMLGMEYTLFIGTLSGILGTVLMYIIRKKIREINRKSQITMFLVDLAITLDIIFVEWSVRTFSYNGMIFLSLTLPLNIILVIISLRWRKWNYSYHLRVSANALESLEGKLKKARRAHSTHNYSKAVKILDNIQADLSRGYTLSPKALLKEISQEKLLKIKQIYVFFYLSEALAQNSMGWKDLRNGKFASASKFYGKSIVGIEKTLKYIEREELNTGGFKSPIEVQFIYSVLDYYRKAQMQSDLSAYSKKKKGKGNNSFDLQEINTQVEAALKEVEESLWIFEETMISSLDAEHLLPISQKIDEKLNKSITIFSNIQDRMKYLAGYMQSTSERFSNSDASSIRARRVNLPLNPNVEENLEEDRIKIIREFEYIGGKIRFKVGVVNYSETIVTNLALRFELPTSLKWIIHEPYYLRRGDTIHIPKLSVGEKIAISLYLEPVNCLKSPINATLTYFDIKDRPNAITMSPKMVSISCPIFFTREDANLARVKNVAGQLKFSDRKVFPVSDVKKAELAFNKILDAIGRHDIKLVHKEFNALTGEGGALYYGITKVNKQKMVLQMKMDSSHHILEIEVFGDDQAPITGLLAELEGQIRDKLLMTNMITDADKFGDINTSVLLGQCPYCSGPISADQIGFFKSGEPINCKYCDTPIVPY